MIRPLHMIRNNKSPGDEFQPISGLTVAELEDFARRMETDAGALASRSAAELEAAKLRHATQQAEVRTMQLQANGATRLASKMGRVL